MLLTTNQWNNADNWWYFSIAIGIIVLLWYIGRDISLHIRAIRAVRISNETRQLQHTSLLSTKEEGAILLSTDFRVIGCNDQVYQYTGLAELKVNEYLMESVSSIFPAATQAAAMKKLDKMLQTGEGKLALEIKLPSGEVGLFEWRLNSIKDDDEIVVYHMSIQPFVPTDRSALLEEELVQSIQHAHEGQEVALFILSIEGLQVMIRDKGLHASLVEMLLRCELEEMERATLHYMSSIDEEKLYVVLSGESVQLDVNHWAECMIEAIHHTVYTCSQQHYVVVKIGVALSLQQKTEIEYLLDEAVSAISMLQHSGNSGYYIYTPS